MDEFFYRFDHLNLIHSNKQAGFHFILKKEAALKLKAVRMTVEEYQYLTIKMRERLLRAKLMTARTVGNAGFSCAEGTACPTFFTTHSMFGGTISADPNDIEMLQRDDAAEQLLPSMTFTPHNMDTPTQALCLLIMIETWAEWAICKL